MTDVISRGSCPPAGGTGAWLGVTEESELLNVLIAEWNHFGYASPLAGQAGIPPLGERNADAIRGGHEAIGVIDRMLRQLHTVCEQLISEQRKDEDIRGRRIDARIAARHAGQDTAATT